MVMLIPAECLKIILGHKGSETFISFFFDHGNARGPVRFKKNSEKPGKEVVEFCAFHWIGEIFTIGTAFIAMFNAACAHLTPGNFLVIVAALAFILQVGFACTAV